MIKTESSNKHITTLLINHTLFSSMECLNNPLSKRLRLLVRCFWTKTIIKMNKARTIRAIPPIIERVTKR